MNGAYKGWYNNDMEDAKEEIRARLAVEDVVGQYIELKRAGRNFKGHSPWGRIERRVLWFRQIKGFGMIFRATRAAISLLS